MDIKNKSRFNALTNAAAICMVLVLLFAAQASGQSQNEPLYFKIVPQEQAEEYFQQALDLKKTGNVDSALEKFESAIVSKRILLSRDDAGLKRALLEKYRTLSSKNKEIEAYYKLAYLMDLTGDLEGSEKNYSTALEMATTDTIKQHISSLLNVVKKDRGYYQKLGAQAASTVTEEPAPPPASESDENGGKKDVNTGAETARKIRESKIADYRDKIEELDRKIADMEKSAAEAKKEERKSKNDWSGREDFKRDWRNTEPVDPLVDKNDPYQNTYRRRYRQAKGERESIEKELEALKEEKTKAEEELKNFELLNPETPSESVPEEGAEQQEKSGESRPE
ncbi:MAG TPA: hypothetical protein PK467_14580 [Candidatus Wallbacteria bacterium]|nr:hypothetical protein [Candidatus Wallbacteria bacterium]